MTNLESQDLGRGCTLLFQRRANTGEVRAVVRNPTGEIIVRGPIVPETDAVQSRRAATMEFMTASMPSARKPAVSGDADEEDIDYPDADDKEQNEEEDEEEEDEE